MESSSRSTRLSPICPPSVAATRLATGMNAVDAGIFSSARSRFIYLGLAFLAVGPAHLARGRRLQLLALSLRGRDPVLDRLADRVVGVGNHLTRPLAASLARCTGSPPPPPPAFVLSLSGPRPPAPPARPATRLPPARSAGAYTSNNAP